MTPRSSCPGEEYHSSPGRKPPAHYRINTVAENCAGGELAATSPGQARRGRGSATDCLGHFWQARPGSLLPRAEDHRLREKSGVQNNGVTLTGIVMENGGAFAADIFIDSSYEGDLMAPAGGP